MRFEMMLPHQIRTAIAEGWPVVLPLGVLEYHGEHLAVGLDTLVVVKALELVEQELNLVILPPFYYGASSYAVAPPEGRGSVHVGADKLAPFAQDLFLSLLRIGFRNVHVVVHHQTENFAAGMPTDLAFKFAARQVLFGYLERERGEGWWGSQAMANYYAEQAGGADPFNWIQVHPLMDAMVLGQFPFDHAGPGETSLLMALCPEGVDMARLDTDPWYLKEAGQASPELAEKGRRLVIDHLKRMFGGKPSVTG
jgi:creatinine amidohydrolase/Fe(II)-dependent formamide hydrolase-like protein